MEWPDIVKNQRKQKLTGDITYSALNKRFKERFDETFDIFIKLPYAKGSACIPVIGLITTSFGAPKNRGKFGLMTIGFGVLITLVSTGLKISLFGVQGTVVNFG